MAIDIARLKGSENPAELLHSWMNERQLSVVDVSANPADLAEIARDRRLALSGISDERGGLSSMHELEGYVSEPQRERFIQDNLLVPSETPNVRLHIVDDLPTAPIPLGLVLADLADWNRPREDARIIELLKGVEWRP
ncbi:hypothetical protein B7R22_12030 [Subtercola boreus]|uniref:Uncharacterized protein n=1 Tax=Subtercola boreus TaxID=120213 RepID=A0A3E0VUH9_9MICO|nr:hypothetical protein [Subtercola boreus]RFA13401.1 hypothetical protein B7R22_12030 [Subtercola boreus]